MGNPEKKQINMGKKESQCNLENAGKANEPGETQYTLNKKTMSRKWVFCSCFLLPI